MDERPGFIGAADKLLRERVTLLEKLVAPAQAAANAMRDAGMKSSADALGAVLFEVDASTQQMRDFVRDNTDKILAQVIGRIPPPR